MTEIAWPTEPDWHLGVTGTRRRVTEHEDLPTFAQVAKLQALLMMAVDHGAKYLHHGCCTGWDEAAVRFCQKMRLDLLIYGHQPDKDTHLSKVAIAWSNVLYKPKPYRERDEDLARESDLILAGPAWPELDQRSKRSGTWLTVRLGRRFGDRLYAVDQQGNITDETEAA